VQVQVQVQVQVSGFAFASAKIERASERRQTSVRHISFTEYC